MGYIVLAFSASSDQEALQLMAEELCKRGYVKPSYKEAVTTRERQFPTGLPVEPIGVAIPHTDTDHVLQGTICLGIPEQPVIFSEMGVENGQVPVQLIFMLAVADKSKHMGVLSRLTELFRDEEALRKLKSGEKAAVDEILSGLSLQED